MGSFSRRYYYFDWWLLLSLIILMIFGVISIYTASTVKIGDEFITGSDHTKQIIWIIISLVSLVLVIKLPLQLLDLVLIPAHIITLIGLIVVLFMPEIKGASRWLIIGPVHIQPGEIAKLTTTLVLAKALSKPHLSELQIILRAVLIGVPPIILLILQPDLGTTIIFWGLLIVMLMFSDLPSYFIIIIISPFIAILSSFYLPALIVFILLLTLVLIKFNLSWVTIGFVNVLNMFIYFSIPIIWNSLRTYQQNRILAFLDPTRDPLGAGYQAIQSRIAIGSGMFQGKGFLEGTQKNLNFLPERHTDFIYSVISEEFGFIGSLLVLFVFFFFIARLINTLKNITIPEQKLFVVGTIAFIATQVLVNIAINLGIFPTTGLPLPFISYGGSSMLANTLAVAIVLKYLTEKSFI